MRGQPIFSSYFFQIKLLNNRHTNVILISILQTHKKRPKTAKMVFLTVKTFFCAFSKYQLKEHLCVYCFKSWIKADKWRNISLGGFSLKTKKTVFRIWNLGPFGIKKNQNFDAHATCPHAENLALNFWNHTWPLVSWPVLTDQKRFPHSTLLYSVQWTIIYILVQYTVHSTVQCLTDDTFAKKLYAT